MRKNNTFFTTSFVGTFLSSITVISALILKVEFLLEIYEFIQLITTTFLLSIWIYVFYLIVSKNKYCLKEISSLLSKNSNKLSNLFSRLSVIGIGIVAFSLGHVQIGIFSLFNLTVLFALILVLQNFA